MFMPSDRAGLLGISKRNDKRWPHGFDGKGVRYADNIFKYYFGSSRLVIGWLSRRKTAREWKKRYDGQARPIP